MSTGSRLILILSAVIGLGVALFPPVVSYRSCQSGLRAYMEDQQDWASALSHKKTLDQVSDRALLRAHNDEDFREGRWHPPTCSPKDDLLLFGLAGITVFVILFVGAHLAWLAGRAFNKLMDKLK